MPWYDSFFRWHDTFWMSRSPVVASEPIVPTTTVAPVDPLEITDYRFSEELVFLSCGIILIVIGIIKPEVFSRAKQCLKKIIKL